MAVIWRKSWGRFGAVPTSESEYRRGIRIKGLYVLLQGFDLALTLAGSSLGFVEVNPVMRSLLASPPQLLAVKVLIPLMIAWLVPGRLLVPAIAFLAAVLGWNIKELLMGM